MISELIGRLIFLTSLAYVCCGAHVSSKSPNSASSDSALKEEALGGGSSDQYFPRSDLVLEMAQLSHSVYKLKRGVGCREHDKELLKLADGTECLHYYHDFELGTQVGLHFS